VSNKFNNLPKTEYKQQLSAEAWRILSLCEGRPLAPGDTARNAAGRPFFPNRDADFSISHSGALAAVSLVKGKNRRTGCDVERVCPRARAREIAKDFFTAPEREYIESGGGFDETRFFHIWTLKECFIKLRGLSVFDMAGVPSFVCGDGSCQFNRGAAAASPLSFNLYELSNDTGERYILATALEGTEMEQPEIRWFSDDVMEVCKIRSFTI
jgi:4'-phosphopantetheinyl transferase